MSYLDTKYPEEIGLGITPCCVWSRNESDRENSIWNIDIIVMQKKSDIIVNKLILRATFLKVAHLYLLFFGQNKPHWLEWNMELQPKLMKQNNLKQK